MVFKDCFLKDPIVLSGHTSAVRNAVFLRNNCFVSTSDDKSLRFWDLNSEQEIERIDFPSYCDSIELSRDKKTLSVCCQSKVSFWDTSNMSKIKEFEIPTLVHSSTLHPENTVFVCGGEDFKMYKYDYNSGVELGILNSYF